MNIEKMKRERKEVKDKAALLAKEMRAINAVAEARDDKAFTAEEDAKYAALDKDLRELEKDIETRSAAIEREERLAEIEKKSAAEIMAKAEPEIAVKDPAGFRNFADWLREVRTNPESARLQQRAVSMEDQSSIGYVVPPEFDTLIRAVSPTDAIVRPRAFKFASSDSSPDASLSFLSLDQAGNKGVYSGVKVNWVGEQDQRTPAGNPTLKQITLEPKEVSAYIDLTNKIMRNYDDASSFLQRLMRQAIIAEEESTYLSGTGIGQPLGFVGHPSNVVVPRKTAGHIDYADLIKMMSLNVGTGNGYVFIAARSASPELSNLKDSAGNLIWSWSARTGEPNTLMGLPVLFSERVPALGDQGDLILVDLQYYAIKDGSPLAIFIDPYTQREFGKTRVYVSWYTDGQPMITGTIKGEDGIARSPFVTLGDNG